MGRFEYRRIVAMGLLLGSCWLGGCGMMWGGGGATGPSGDVQILIEEGWNAYEVGDYMAAISKFNRVIAIDDRNAEAYNALGWCYFALRMLESAKLNFMTAKEITPTYIDPYVGLAGVHLADNNYTSGASYAEQAIALEPASFDFRPADPASNYQFSHNPDINAFGLRLVLAESFYYMGNFSRLQSPDPNNAQSQIDIVDPDNGLNPTDSDYPQQLLRNIEQLHRTMNSFTEADQG